LLSFSFPQGFKHAYEKVNGPSYIQESVPEGETIDNWTQMITITGAHGLASKPDLSPQKFAQNMAGRIKGRCPNSFSTVSVFDGQIGGYDGFAAVMSCGTSPLTTGHSESFLVTVIKGDSDYYTVQWAERAELSSTPITIDTARWLDRFNRLGPITLCQIVPGEAAPYPSCVDSNVQPARTATAPQQQTPGQDLQSFTIYSGNNPSDASGKRLWWRINGSDWQETSPNGNVTTMKFVEKIVVNGVSGSVLRKTDDTTQELFLPDNGSGSGQILSRSFARPSWISLGVMSDAVIQCRQSFTFFNGNNSSDASSKRLWKMADGLTWQEIYPNGYVTTLKFVGQIAINGVNGSVWKKTDDTAQEVFLPDCGSGSVRMLWHSSTRPWAPSGDIREN
jgi:hypothetical protein